MKNTADTTAGNSSGKKTEEIKKIFTQISSSTIKHIADAQELTGLPKKSLDDIAENVGYLIRESLQSAANVTRHCRRRKVTTEDVNKALQHSGLEPLYGYDNPKPLVLKTKRDKVNFVAQDVKKNLASNALGGKKEVVILSSAKLQGSWLVRDGYGDFSDIKKADSVSPELKNYYLQNMSSILGPHDELILKACKDLSTNINISQLLPYFAHFVSTAVNKMGYDLLQLRKVLFLIEALISNPSLYIGHKSYLCVFVQFLLYCITDEFAKALKHKHHHQMLRRAATYLLAKTLKEYTAPETNLLQMTLLKLESIIRDREKPVNCRYAAIGALCAIGTSALEKVLLPHLSFYFEYVNSVFLSDDNTDAFLVHDLLLYICEILLLSWHRKLPDTSDKSFINHAELYQKFYEQFGDSLTGRLPMTYEDSSRKKQTNLFCETNATASGMELLMKIHKMEEEKSEPADVSVDGELVTKNEVDLQVRSTVSAHGIKLTIKKTPRHKPAKESPVKKMRWRSKKLQFNSMFDPVVQRRRIRIDIRGCKSKSVSDLKCRRYLVQHGSQTVTLTQKTKRKVKGKMKVFDRRSSYKKIFKTCSLTSIL